MVLDVELEERQNQLQSIISTREPKETSGRDEPLRRFSSNDPGHRVATELDDGDLYGYPLDSSAPDEFMTPSISGLYRSSAPYAGFTCLENRSVNVPQVPQARGATL